MQDKNQYTPELRFPEFHDDWQVKNGDELFDSIVNKNHNSDLPILAITQEQGAVPREMIDYKIAVTDKSIESYKVVEIGDFIISLRSFKVVLNIQIIKVFVALHILFCERNLMTSATIFSNIISKPNDTFLS